MRECLRPAAISSWLKPAWYDYYLHAQHEHAAEKKCETCHHVYDQTQQKLVYQKGAEESCRSCHRDVPEEKRPSFRTASHTKCVNCHLEKSRAGRTAGPSSITGMGT
nr:cytochrome c3 family protein [Deltaproteobacteria bacterium]